MKKKRKTKSREIEELKTKIEELKAKDDYELEEIKELKAKLKDKKEQKEAAEALSGIYKERVYREDLQKTDELNLKKNITNIVVSVILIFVLIFGFNIVKWGDKMDTKENKISTEVSKMQIVVIETNKGNIEIELNQEKAPITVENFLNYVKNHYYDGTVFHRIINNFMIQGGGFTPDGKEKQTNNPIKLESNNSLKNDEGTIAMARTMITDSATSQFFINVKSNDFLNYAPGNDGYAVFGKVISGMEVVNEIKEVTTEIKFRMQDWPTEDVVIKKVYLKE